MRPSGSQKQAGGYSPKAVVNLKMLPNDDNSVK
jgi:hypothetical protein